MVLKKKIGVVKSIPSKKVIGEVSRVMGDGVKVKRDSNRFLKTHVPGMDELFQDGIPKGKAVLVEGSPGTGKTIFCLHLGYNACLRGKKDLYMSFEESEESLVEHMVHFGWDVHKMQKELESGVSGKTEEQIKEQREKITSALEKGPDKFKIPHKVRIKTGIEGFDKLVEKGIPKSSSILVAGGAGSGKTLFCLQTLMNKVREGKRCFYMSFEESEKKLIAHMNDFGWDAQKYIDKGLFKIQRYSPFDIARNVEAMLAKEKGELLIDLDPVILPTDFKPDFIVLDSLTAVASAFTGKEDSYRIYIEQLFRFFEKLDTTSFLITETKQIPEVFSTTGVEEFLADGVIVMYAIKRENIRENAIEILKMRGTKHQKKIVAMSILSGKGVEIYPEQEVFGGLGTSP